MNFPRVGRADGPVGVEFAPGVVRMVQFAPLPGGASSAVARAEQVLAPNALHNDPRRVAMAIRAVLRRNGFRGRHAVAALPIEAVSAWTVRLPDTARADLSAAVRARAGQCLDEPLDSVRVQFRDAGRVERGAPGCRELILLAAPASVVDRQVETLSLAGLDPLRIESAPEALVRLARARAEGATAVIAIGQRKSVLVLADADRVRLLRPITVAMRHFDRSVASYLQIPLSRTRDLRAAGAAHAAMRGDDRSATLRRSMCRALSTAAEDLARELALCIRYVRFAFRCPPPERLWLFGGEGYQQALCATIGQTAGLAVEPISRPLPAAPAGESWAQPPDGERWAVAAGMALWRPAETAQCRAA